MRLAAAPDPDERLKLDGCLALGPNLSIDTCFLTSALATMQAAMLLILCAVCGNTANLLLARAGVRRREMSIRLAIGAGRGRLVRLVLVENLILALLGSLLGAAIAVWGTDALRAGEERDAIAEGHGAIVRGFCYDSRRGGHAP